MIEIRHAGPALRAVETLNDYPRQPRVDMFTGAIQAVLGDRVVLRSNRGMRLLQRGRVPLVFIPPAALSLRHARPSDTLRIDDIGLAVHLDLVQGGHVARDAAWYYPGPDPDLAIIAGMLCLDPSRFDAVTVDGQRVLAGSEPGAWITPNLHGLVVHRHGAA